MNRSSRRLLSAASLIILISGSATADDKWNSHLVTDILTQSESGRDLGVANGGDDASLAINIRSDISWQPTNNSLYFAKGRLFQSSGSFVLDSDDGGSTSDGFASIDEFWGQYYFSPSHSGFGLQVGRQRIKESDALWWDQDIESIRLNYTTTLLNGFVGIGEKLTSYRSDKSDFDDTDEGQFRIMGELDYQWRYGHSVALRGMVLIDHSDEIKTGNVTPDDRENLDAAWLGIRTKGVFSADSGRWGYFVDGTYMSGDRTRIDDIQSGIVTNVSDESVSGWAFDIGGWKEWNHYLKPKLGGHFALTSSGDEFVQTGLNSNRTYLSETDSRFYRYGELFRPQLSNIQVLTAFSSIDLKRTHELSVIGHHYTRRDTNAGIDSGGINAPLLNGESDLGSELDFVYAWNLTQKVPARWDWVKKARLRARFSTFFPGAAYGPEADDVAYRLLVNLSTNF